jgi:hypothetical protein
MKQTIELRIAGEVVLAIENANALMPSSDTERAAAFHA